METDTAQLNVWSLAIAALAVMALAVPAPGAWLALALGWGAAASAVIAIRRQPTWQPIVALIIGGTIGTLMTVLLARIVWLNLL